MHDEPVTIIRVVFEQTKGSHKGRRYVAPYLTQAELNEEKRRLEADSDPFQRIIAEGVSREEALRLCSEAIVADLCRPTED